MDETRLYKVDAIKGALIGTTLDEIFDALKEKGYDPVNQIVGYLLSGDPNYITTYKDSRKKILEFDRELILNVIVSDYLGVR